MAAAAAAPAFSAVLHGTVALEGVSAASGLEIAPDGVTGYVPGDDSVFLYQISIQPGGAGARVERKLRMADSKDVDKATGAVLTEEGIPKKVKPDFEAIALLPLGPSGAPRLTVFGSGSKAGLRDGISCLDPLTETVDQYDGSALMSALRGDTRVTGAAKLNLEGAALVGEDTVALFNRGNTPGSANSVVLMDAAALRDHLAAGAPVPRYTVVHLTLPPISHDGAAYGAGISGASTVFLPSSPGQTEAGQSGQSGEECLLISASYEATLNEIDDGDVLGSRLALLPAATLRRLATAAAASGPSAAPPSLDLGPLSALIVSAPSRDDGSGGAAPVICKVEGVAAVGQAALITQSEAAAAASAYEIEALAVTDPDGGSSEMLRVKVVAPAALLRAAEATAVEAVAAAEVAAKSCPA